jgi:hypothetical protein
MTDSIDTDLRFSIVPHWVTNSDVSDRALRLYSVLAKFADAETGQAFPGRTRLSKELRCSLKSVDRAVAELESIGAVRKMQRVKDGYYQSSLYTVVRIDPGSGKSRPRATDDATPCQDGRDPVSPVTHRTITTELEPVELEPLKERTRENRATRLPQDWYPSERLLEMFVTKWPNLDQQFEIEDFILYWHSVPTTKTDWDRTFQRWMNTNQQKAVKQRLVRGERLTNNKKAALLAQKYRAEAQAQRELEAVENPQQVKELESEVSTWLKGVDDV